MTGHHCLRITSVEVTSGDMISVFFRLMLSANSPFDMYFSSFEFYHIHIPLLGGVFVIWWLVMDVG